MTHRLLAFFILFCTTAIGLAQNTPSWKKNGDKLLEAQQYQAALEAYLQAEQQPPADAETRTNIGICHYHLHQPEQSEASLFSAHQAKGSPPPLNYLYLGKLHQARLDFEKAVIFYKKYLKKTPPDHPWRSAVKDEIRRCATGIRVRRQPANTIGVLPLAGLSSIADEHRPLPSPSGAERLYFSASAPSGENTDIFFSELKNGDWAAPQPLSPFVNSTEHEQVLGFDEQGHKLYFFRGKNTQNGQVFVDTFRENPLERTLFFEPFDSPMHPESGDCAPHFFNDSILLFASARTGGYGGLDLYVTTRHGTDWTPAENLGPVINSAYDDTSPFLARDGRTLYFSSNDASRSFGGLDILTSTYLDWSHRWSPPVNLGPPVNAAADDAGFVLSNSGDRAFFDSDRITSKGGRDLYVALFDAPREEQFGTSSPVAFHLIAEGQQPNKATEIATQPLGFFDNINSFELPVMQLPAPGGTPGEDCVRQFAQLAQLLKKYPKLRPTLALHSAPSDDPVAFFRFASQTATDLLRQEGVGKERVMLLYAGSSFPLVDSPRRVDIFIENPAELPFELYRPTLPPDAHRARFFQKTMASLGYRVTVLATEIELQKLFELYPDGLAEQSADGKAWRFSPGLYLTFASADAWRQTLAQDGYTTAYITAHLRGRELSKEEANRYLEDFPDLKEYIGK